MDDAEAGIDFEKLFEETSSMIYSLGMRLFRNEEDAGDFTQEVFLRAYTQLHRFEGRSRASTWLYSLAMNLGLNRIRKEKRVREDSVDPGDMDRRAGEPVDPLAFDRTGDVELENRVRSELDQLPETYRIPLLLHYFEKLPYAQIAENLGLKEGTLKSLIHRGKILLRSALKEKVKEHDAF